MESAALYLNAARAGKRGLCVCTITDDMITGEGISSMDRQTKLDEMITLAFKRAREKENITFTIDTNILAGVSFGGAKGSKGAKM